MTPTEPAAPTPALADCEPPIWVGQLDVESSEDLEIGQRYTWARVLPRNAAAVGEPVLVPVTDGRVQVQDVRRAAADWMTQHPRREHPRMPDGMTVGVTVSTHDRPQQVARMLASLRAVEGDISILVVDNAPSSDASRVVVERCAEQDPRIRYVLEPRKGLSVARNRALRKIGTDILLFTDDDVEVDAGWVAGHAEAYQDPAVDLTSGPAFAARLEIRDEILSESIIAWSKGPNPRRFSMAQPPADSPIFPFSPGILGGGLNFGVRVARARHLGGFDEALGAGSRTQGGEDCDFFIRMIRRGATLQYCPDAFVWHYHRDQPGDFEKQMQGSGVGLGAYLGKLLMEPRAVAQITKRVPSAIRHLQHLRQTAATAGGDSQQGGSDWGAVVRGAVVYPLARREVLRAGGHVAHRPL